MVSDPFWYEDPTILIKSNRFSEFFPHNEMSFEEKLNAMVRFAIYFAILLFAFKKTANKSFIGILFPLFVLGLTLFLYQNGNGKETMSTLDGGPKYEDCQLPTDENPFMNVLISDYTANPQKKKACNVSDKKVKQEIKDKFENNLYRDTIDIWGRNNSQREYYTMPNTTIPNDQTNFANWLYKTSPTCKELTTYCITENDVRHNRRPIHQLIKDGR